MLGLTIITGGAAVPLLARIGAVAFGALGAATAAANGTDIGAGFLTGVLVGAAVGAVAGMGGAYLAGGLASVGGKFAEDLFAYFLYGSPMGTWEDYAVAFVFGGLSNGLFGPGLGVGMSGITGAPTPGGFLLDVFIRPAINQLVNMGTGRQDGFNKEKYVYDITTRAITYFLPNPIKSLSRGITKGTWYRKKHPIIGYQYV